MSAKRQASAGVFRKRASRLSRPALDDCDGGLTLVGFKHEPYCEIEALGWLEDPRGEARAFWRRFGERGDEIWVSSPMPLKEQSYPLALADALGEIVNTRARENTIGTEAPFRMQHGWFAHGGDVRQAAPVLHMLKVCGVVAPAAMTAGPAQYRAWRLKRFQEIWKSQSTAPVALGALERWLERWGLPMQVTVRCCIAI